MLDLSDSLCTYDISLFTRSDFPAFTPRTHRDIPLDIVLTSPSGREFSERVFFPTVTPLRSTVFPKITWPFGVPAAIRSNTANGPYLSVSRILNGTPTFAGLA